MVNKWMAINSEKEVYKYSNVHINQLEKPNKKNAILLLLSILVNYDFVFIVYLLYIYIYIYNMSKRYILIYEKIK